MLDALQAFLALNFDVGSIRRVAGVQRALRGAADTSAGSVAWVSPTNLHLVVRVLPDMDRALVPALTDALRGTADALSSTHVQLGVAEGYPAPDRARLLIVRVTEASGVLAQVVLGIEQAIQRFGFSPVSPPAEPVLILGRMAAPVDVTAWLAAAGTTPAGDSRVTEIALLTNELKGPGAEYTALARIPVVGVASPRSQRPSRAPKPSQRPRPRSKPPAGEPASGPAEGPAIPKPPRLPSVPAPAAGPPVEAAPKAGSEIPPPPPSRPLISPLPPSLESALPDEDEWK